MGLPGWRVLAAGAATMLFVGCGGSTPAQDSRADRMSAAVENALSSESQFDAVEVVLVVAGGETLVERYGGTEPDDFHPVQSVTKSVVSTLVGVAIEDGLLDLDDTLAEMLPEYAEEMRPRVAAVTLADLLTMRGGFAKDTDTAGFEFATAPDAVAAALATGTGSSDTFSYSSAGSHLVAAALAEATGGSVLEYAREVLFGPIGVDTEPAAEPILDPANGRQYLAADFAWPVDRQGIHQGWAYLKLRPADMLALGQLFLDGGMWDGEPVVSQAWVDDATSAHAAIGGDDSYGYFWVVTPLAGHDAFAAIGYGAQLVVVVPDLDLVAVTVTDLGADMSSQISPQSMLTLVESTINVGYREE